MTDLIIRNAHVLDVHTGTYTEGDIRIAGGEVVEVGVRIGQSPSEVAVVDAHGGFVLPGLIDAHVHVTAHTADLGANETSPPTLLAAHASQIMRGMLNRGFTMVRDVGGADFGLARA